MELPIKQIENFVFNKKKNIKLVTHSFGHLKRAAIGAEWFVKFLGGSEHEQKLAYIAGLLHDIVRYPTEKIPHAEMSAKRSEGI